MMRSVLLIIREDKRKETISVDIPYAIQISLDFHRH